MEIQHTEGSWQQYDILLASGIYGWDYAIHTAEYMASTDLMNIGTVSITPTPNGQAIEYIDEYHASGESFKAIKILEKEAANIGIGGISKVIGAPVKIVWFNQTKVIRIFTPIHDEKMMKRYAETVIRRTFGTSDAMKKYKPIPKKLFI